MMLKFNGITNSMNAAMNIAVSIDGTPATENGLVNKMVDSGNIIKGFTILGSILEEFGDFGSSADIENISDDKVVAFKCKDLNDNGFLLLLFPGELFDTPNSLYIIENGVLVLSSYIYFNRTNHLVLRNIRESSYIRASNLYNKEFNHGVYRI